MTIALDGTPLVQAPHTGIARYTRELAAALRVALPEVEFTLESRPESAGLLEGRWWSIGLPRRLREIGASLFHGTDFAVPLLGKTPSVVTVHDLSPLRAREWHMPATAIRVARRLPGVIARSRAVITPSERVKAEIVERFATPPDNIFVTPLAAAAAFQPKPEPVSQPYLLYVGSGQDRKNLAALLRAFERLRKDLGIELLCIGKDLPFALQLGVRTTGVRTRESITDEELARLYSGASVFVYPSLYEGFGLPVVEAMACGAPVVVWRGTACSDVGAGAAMEASSEEELEAAIRAVLVQPDLAADMRKRSLAKALCYSWTATAKKTWEAYESALSRS